MNKSKLVWGIICLIAAGGLAVANLALPPEDLMFQIGDQNLPWIPVVVLAIGGTVLIATSYQGETKMSEHTSKPVPVVDSEKAALNKRLETMFWGLFLIMLGGQFLLKGFNLPDGIWDVGIGLIFLGLNAARYFNGLRMSGFTTFLGILALVGGFAQLAFQFDFGGALLLIVLGAYLILKPWFDRRQLFGKAEQG